MPRIMLFREIGVHGVSIIARNHQGALHEALIAFFAVQADVMIDALEHIGKEGPLGTTGAGTADFFMIGGDEQRPLTAIGLQQRLETGVAGQQIVEAGTGDQLTLQPRLRRRLQVMQAQLEVDDIRDPHAVLLLNQLDQQRVEGLRGRPGLVIQLHDHG